MIKFFRVPDEYREQYTTWKGSGKGARGPWLSKAIESEEKFLQDVEGTGTTYTQSQYNNVKDATGMAFTLPLSYQALKQALALMMHTKPSLRILSLDGRAKNHAALLDKMKHAVLYNSHAQMELEGAVRDMLVTGLGHLMIVPLADVRGGIFNLGIIHVPFDEVILDINAKKKSLEDMEGFFIEKAFTIPRFIALYSDILKSLRDQNGNPVDVKTFTGNVWIEGQLTDKQSVTTTTWGTDDHVIVREYYKKVFTTMYGIQDPQTGVLKYFFAENMQTDEQALLSMANVSFPDLYVHKTIMFGDFVVWEEVLPVTQWPLVTFVYEWGGRPYNSKGMMHFATGAQEAFDKTTAIMILNGILSNNAGWKAPVGSIDEKDRHKWEEYANDPRAIRFYNPVVREGNVFVPEKDEPRQLGNFYPELLQLLKTGIEGATGITAVLAGDAKETNIEIFSTLQQYQSTAMQRIQLYVQNMNQVMVMLGQSLIEHLIMNISDAEYVFFDEKGFLNEVKLSKEIANDIKSFKYLTVAIPGTALPTQRLAMADTLGKIAQSSPDPVERSLYTQTAMDLSELREFDDLREKLDVVRNTQSKLDSLQQAYERLMETSKQIENRYINAELENRILKKIAGAEQKVTEGYADIKAKMTIAEEILKQKDSSENKQ